MRANQSIPILPDQLYTISRIASRAPEWRPALDRILQYVRPFFIFDNLAVYLMMSDCNLDISYAKAAGRGKKAEADVSWGENLAAQIYSTRKTVVEEPKIEPKDRLQRPFVLGVPIEDSRHCLGSLIVIRFGSPAFTSEEIAFAQFLGEQVSVLVEQERLSLAADSLKVQTQLIKLQEDFISTLSHEFRTPLGFIKGYATTLLRSDTKWDHATTQEFLTIIDHETDRMQELIDNLLDSARLQSGQMKMSFQIVRLDALLNDVIARAQMHFPTLMVNLMIDPHLPSIQGDPSRLAQVFENLLNNSTKYAPNSQVTIHLESQQDGVRITFKDDGPGILPQYLPHIFERFFRIPDQVNAHGTGLGLWICSQIVQAHHGTISVQSEIGQGTTFLIFIPYSNVGPT